MNELLEQGNAFEAEVVKGVEDAGDADKGEVAHTRCRRMMFRRSISIRSSECGGSCRRGALRQGGNNADHEESFD